MHVQELFKQSAIIWSSKPSLCFAIKGAYPRLFFSHIIQHAKAVIPIEHLNMYTRSKNEIKAQLETSFLGMQRSYWLGSLDELSKKDQSYWLSYIRMYQGPNRVLYTISAIDAQKNDIAVPESVNKSFFVQLFQFFVREKTLLDTRRIDELFARTDSMELDTACLLLHYIQVLGAKSKLFFDQWLDQLVVPKTSLFHLSQHFFSKQRTFFFREWHAIKDTYHEQFWISYWSDQIWRAHFYCDLMKRGNIAEAKKMGFRLPFRFLQRDYKQCNMQELYTAHQALYELDYALKNGGDPIGLDIFFFRYFADNFVDTK